ncbi:hypothetical protein [Nocardiopsis alba]|uniref:hypothetical protein n=1 Tax=Nocardiopsis alba TaxID=53437 RepID=UPI003D730E6F
MAVPSDGANALFASLEEVMKSLAKIQGLVGHVPGVDRRSEYQESFEDARYMAHRLNYQLRGWPEPPRPGS